MKRVTPKKYLGQHFLKDQNIAKKIADSLSKKGDELVIEVGPGMGVLTQFLIDRPNFVALDVDSESIDYLKESYPDNAEQFVLKDFLKEELEGGASRLSIIGNFPYNISSQIFFKVFDNRNRVGEVVCMIQKEVADRIASKEGNKVYGILSVLLQAFYDIEYLFTVKPGVFHPPPKVNSAVIRLIRNNTESLECNEAFFKRIVKMGFNQRRKTLRNALKALALSEEDSKIEILNQRAEQLSVNQFIELTRKLEQYA